MKLFRFALVLSLPLVSLTSNAYTVDVLSPSYHDANLATLNTNLGLTSTLVFEEFDDALLAQGLSVTFNTAATAPQYINLDTNLSGTFSDADWSDASAMMVNGYSFARFAISGGTSVFGLGLGGVLFSGSTIEINDSGNLIDVSLDSDWQLTNANRNGYVVINSEVGDAAISAVTFRISTPQADTTFFDHVAFEANSVPAPASTFVLLLGALLLTVSSVRQK